ncbi:MAG TPA: hypothetical protein VFB60_07550 [Ktedonobacteraceae bacterium]|nr:hypothetical protein [Ktedonobacteraceae bacterium]
MHILFWEYFFPDYHLASEASNCTSYHDSGSSDGTNNEDIMIMAAI